MESYQLWMTCGVPLHHLKKLSQALGLLKSQHIDQCRVLQYGLEPLPTCIVDFKSDISEL